MRLIWNPASAGGRTRHRLDEAMELLAAAGLDVEPIATEGPGHAIDLARDLAGGTLLAMGGDGTVSEVCQGVLASGRPTRLGFLPSGTGNDFLRDFHIHRLSDGVARIAAGATRSVDAAKVTTADGERAFVNVFGTGFMAQAGATADRRFKRLGARGYTLAVLWELARLSNVPTRLVLDGKEQHLRTAMVAVCNSVHTGGAMRLAPAARPDDGELDVLTCHDVGRIELARIFRGVFTGEHVHHPKVRMERAKTVEIETERPLPLLMDGEVLGRTPVRIEVLPGALTVYA